MLGQIYDNPGNRLRRFQTAHRPLLRSRVRQEYRQILRRLGGDGVGSIGCPFSPERASRRGLSGLTLDRGREHIESRSRCAGAEIPGAWWLPTPLWIQTSDQRRR